MQINCTVHFISNTKYKTSGLDLEALGQDLAFAFEINW